MQNLTHVQRRRGVIQQRKTPLNQRHDVSGINVIPRSRMATTECNRVQQVVHEDDGAKSKQRARLACMQKMIECVRETDVEPVGGVVGGEETPAQVVHSPNAALTWIR